MKNYCFGERPNTGNKLVWGRCSNRCNWGWRNEILNPGLCIIYLRHFNADSLLLGIIIQHLCVYFEILRIALVSKFNRFENLITYIEFLWTCFCPYFRIIRGVIDLS